MSINSGLHTRTIADVHLHNGDYQQRYINNSSKTTSDDRYELLLMSIFCCSVFILCQYLFDQKNQGKLEENLPYKEKGN
jgi:hypothetical protein